MRTPEESNGRGSLRRKPIRVLFDAYHLYHLPQFDPVIDLLVQDPRFEVAVSTSRENPVEEQELTHGVFAKRHLPIVTAETEPARANAIRQWCPDVFICGWSRYRHGLENYVPASTLVAMIYHGIGVKPSYWQDNDPRLNLRFVEGSYRVDQLRQFGVKTDLELVGFAKLDPAFNGTLPARDTILRELGLDPQKKTILYAPTFYPSSFERVGHRLGEYTHDYNLIIKLHMWTYFKDHFSVDLRPQRRLANQLAQSYRHVATLPLDCYNITPYLHAADLLITEASSTMYEMMALNKPVVSCQFFRLRWTHRLLKQRLYRNRLNEEMLNELTGFCTKAAKPRDLPAALASAIGGTGTQSELYQGYQDAFFYHRDGKACERIRDTLLRRLAGQRLAA